MRHMKYIVLVVAIVASLACSAAFTHDIKHAKGSVRLRNSAASAAERDFSRLVALTREPSRNKRLEEALSPRKVDTVTLPCIQHLLTDNVHEVADALRSKQYDGVIITSPEGASVFVDQWRTAGAPEVTVVSLGTATTAVLTENGVSRDKIWQPSKAYASVLVDELPDGLAKRYLYPCSALARPTLTDGLREWGVDVTVIPAYTTVPHPWRRDEIELAKHIKFAAVASPSAVRSWKHRAGTKAKLVCIGKTTADAAVAEGFKRVTYPQTAAFEDWVELIIETVKQASLARGIIDVN